MVSQASSNLPWPRVSVVIPTLNEARNLPYVFSRLPADVYEVIVVDGQSVDDTIAVAPPAAARRPGSAADWPRERERPCLRVRSCDR